MYRESFDQFVFVFYRHSIAFILYLTTLCSSKLLPEAHQTMTRTNNKWRRKALLPLTIILAISCISTASGLQEPTISISSTGSIFYEQPPTNLSSALRGVSWYGLDSDPSWYNMNADYFNFLIQTFPKMSLLSLPVSANVILPNIDQGDYNTVDNAKLNLLKNFVAWCKPHQIKILLSNYWESIDEAKLIAYWKFMAREFLEENTIIGFDLINEPWAFAHGDTGLVQTYRNIIDAIRSVDPNRTCYFQSMFYHYEGGKLRNLLETNPLNRTNVVYIDHLYSQDANTGEWYDSYTSPWIPYYLAHDYTKAKQVLENTPEGYSSYGGLYQRFGFIKQELGYDVAVMEIATIDTPEGHQYLRDALDILNQWGISWAYHPWYTNMDRPISLTYPNGTLRPKAGIIGDYMQVS
jgi:hypothetical protein